MPGAIRTEQGSELFDAKQALFNDIVSRQSLKRRGYAKDLAGAFGFLARDDSTFMTGEVVNLDGGWVNY